MYRPLLVLFTFWTYSQVANSKVTPSPGCSITHLLSDLPANDSSLNLTITSPLAGGQRHFLLHLPSSSTSSSTTTTTNTEPAPLIIALHGKSQTPEQFERQTQLSSINSSVVAYPAGLAAQWTGDPAAPLPSEINDVEFVSDLIMYLTENYCIDTSRVYVVGFSNGGGLADLVACNPKVSSRIAAVAIASGAFYRDSALREPLFNASTCTPDHIMPILEFHGSKDPVEHYDGRGTPDGPSIAIPEWLDGWVGRAGCIDNVIKGKKMEDLYDGKVEKRSWSCGSFQDVVVHYWIKGFGHGWPSTARQEDDAQQLGPAVFNATAVIVEFFAKWALPEEASHIKVEVKDEL